MNERKDYNYRGMATQGIIKTKKTLEGLVGKYSDDKTLKILKDEIIKRMEINSGFLDSWYKNGIEKEWDAVTITEGKASCLSNINALELLTEDIKGRLKEARI